MLKMTVWCRCDCGHVYKYIAKGRTHNILDENISESKCPKCKKGGPKYTDYFNTKKGAEAG